MIKGIEDKDGAVGAEVTRVKSGARKGDTWVAVEDASRLWEGGWVDLWFRDVDGKFNNYM